MVRPRYLEAVLQQHLSTFRQMVFLSGPRQVGKTTLARSITSRLANSSYFNWDNVDHRELILQGLRGTIDAMDLERAHEENTFAVFDELHKYTHWRDFLKGLYDTYPSFRALVTGSASLAVFSRGGDSLRGRYFLYHLHPFSVAELSEPANDVSTTLNRIPKQLPQEQWEALLRFGGFPEPFFNASESFFERWRKSSRDQLIREEIRDLTSIRELSQIEFLAIQIRQQVSQLSSYSTFARTTRCSVDTIRRWIEILESLHYCFRVSPWFTNVVRSLRKEPKYYLWDWAQVDDQNARAENFVASALAKAVQFWVDSGQGSYALHFLRDKEKREVDFVVVRDDRPWFLVEVKTSDSSRLSPSLKYFHEQLGTAHAFQVAMDADFIERDCFEYSTPVIVPAKTFLAQLV